MDSRQRATIAQRSRRVRATKPPRGNPYRFSRGFIRRMTVALCITIVALPAAGFIYGATLGSDYEQWQSNLALALIIGGFVLPLLVAAVLGGRRSGAGAGSSGSCSRRA